jgi:hypothetical protein
VAERKIPEVLFALSDYGFSVVEATASKLTLRFVDSHGRELYTYTLQR